MNAETISSAIKKLNSEYYLPAIQREFVWQKDQIRLLFDSVLRGYPISSFLLWELDAENISKWTAYEFLKDVSSDGTRNAEANLETARKVIFVLDGQQRLTALHVGLKGTFSTRKKGKRRTSPDAYTKSRMFIDLLHDPESEDSDSEDGTSAYRFDFFESAPESKPDEHWFLVGKISSVDGPSQLRDLTESEWHSAHPMTPKSLDFVFRENLKRLYDAVHKDMLVNFHSERIQDYDRVLDIFVRANSGGTKLSKSDLLMSTVVGHWDDLNAREEIHGFVDYLNEGLTRPNNISKDLVMKACLVLSNLEVKYRVANFNSENLQIIRKNWNNIKISLERSLKFVNSFGIDATNLTSVNALIPIAYFFSTRPRITLMGESSYEIRNRKLIHQWLIYALVSNTFSARTDAILTSIRETLSGSKSETDDFPLKELIKRSGGDEHNYVSDFTDKLLSLKYGTGNKETYLALTLLYESKNWGSEKPHIDHIMPRSSKFDDILNEQWLSDRDQIANLSLILPYENTSKSDKPFSEWLGTMDESYIERHLIPADVASWSIESFADFQEQREKLIEQRILELFKD